MQVVILTLSFLIYLPFIRRVDKQSLMKEAKTEKEALDDEW